MAAVPCIHGHLTDVPDDDVTVHMCCGGPLNPEDCPTCQEMHLHGIGADFSRPGGIPQPDRFDQVMAEGG